MVIERSKTGYNNEIIESIKNIILDTASKGIIDTIYLFGSYAYGIPNKNSDIDIFVIIDDYSDRLSEYAKIKMKLRRCNIRLCDLVLSKNYDFYESIKINKNGIENRIFTNGKILYEK